MTDDELARLRAVAEGATRGPWRLREEADYGRGGEPIAWREVWSERSMIHRGGWVGGDAAHIAAFDPPTALRLLDEVERLRGLVDPRLAVAWDDEDASRYDAIPVIE